MKSKINIVQFIDWRCFFFFIIDTCGVLKKGLPEKGPTKFHFSRDYWLFYTAISRKVIWDMINTLFLILSVAVDRTFFFSFSTRKHSSMASRVILSNFFEEQWIQNHPQYLSGLSCALFPTTFLEIAVYQLCISVFEAALRIFLWL